MIIVLDASAAIEIALEKELSGIYKKLINSADVTIAPDSYIAEITNVFWKYRQFSQFSDETCIKGIQFCIGLIDDFVASTDLWREAYSEGVNLDHSTYDMFYMVLARRNNALLLTRDKKMNQLAQNYKIKTS